MSLSPSVTAEKHQTQGPDFHDANVKIMTAAVFKHQPCAGISSMSRQSTQTQSMTCIHTVIPQFPLFWFIWGAL